MEYVFCEKLKELLALAKKKKNVLEHQEIMDLFTDMDLSPEQMDKIFEFLEANNVDTLRTTDMDDVDEDGVILDEEEIGACDVAIAVTNNDERNLLCSLLVKQLGVKRVVSRVSKITNASLFQKVGIDVTLSSITASINEIKSKFLRNPLLA